MSRPAHVCIVLLLSQDGFKPHPPFLVFFTELVGYLCSNMQASSPLWQHSGSILSNGWQYCSVLPAAPWPSRNWSHHVLPDVPHPVASLRSAPCLPVLQAVTCSAMPDKRASCSCGMHVPLRLQRGCCPTAVPCEQEKKGDGLLHIRQAAAYHRPRRIQGSAPAAAGWRPPHPAVPGWWACWAEGTPAGSPGFRGSRNEALPWQAEGAQLGMTSKLMLQQCADVCSVADPMAEQAEAGGQAGSAPAGSLPQQRWLPPCGPPCRER